MTAPRLTETAGACGTQDSTPDAALPQIVHVIPYDGIGGVETAAASVDGGRYAGFVFRKAYIASKRPGNPHPYVYESGVGTENSPLAFIRTVRHLLRLRPTILVLSLWRSCIVGLLVKALRPRTRLVIFLHNIRNSNWIDSVLTRLAVAGAEAVWADSASTAAQRLGPSWASRARPISFLTARLDRVTGAAAAPSFITWGRLHPRKRIDLAVDFFALVHKRHADATLSIIGPDRGEQPMLEAKVRELGLTDAVQFLGPADLSQIARHAATASFFVQTSWAEGMGMAVVEAMQMGLVPVVTPVGEIGTYVNDGRNGIWFTDPGATADRVAQVLTDPGAYRALSDAAAGTWQGRPLYRDQFLGACAELSAAVDAPKR